GAGEIEIRNNTDVSELEHRTGTGHFTEISRPQDNVIACVVIAMVVHHSDVTVERDGPAGIFCSEISNRLRAVVRFLQDPSEILVVVDGENLGGFRDSWLCFRFRGRLRGGLFGVRGCHGFGRGRVAAVFLQRHDGEDASDNYTGAAECGPQSPGCLWLRSAEGQGGSQSTLLLGDQFPTVLLLVRDRFRLGAPDRLDFSDLVLRFLGGHISSRPSIRVWWVTRT